MEFLSWKKFFPTNKRRWLNFNKFHNKLYKISLRKRKKKSDTKVVFHFLVHFLLMIPPFPSLPFPSSVFFFPVTFIFRAYSISEEASLLKHSFRVAFLLSRFMNLYEFSLNNFLSCQRLRRNGN